ncbi:MAG: hypothetical protein ACFCUR_14185 [Rhodomicrobiaceae bacterium]
MQTLFRSITDAIYRPLFAAVHSSNQSTNRTFAINFIVQGQSRVGQKLMLPLLEGVAKAVEWNGDRYLGAKNCGFRVESATRGFLMRPKGRVLVYRQERFV